MPTSFSQRVLNAALAIPAGRVTTYGHLARSAGGGAQSARSVTSILAKYPNQNAIPYHRIVYASGRVWWNDEHKATRQKLFAREGIVVNERGYVTDFAEYLWDPAEAVW